MCPDVSVTHVPGLDTLLVLSTGTRPPVKLGNKGLLFMDPTDAVILAVIGGGTINASFNVPGDAVLTGIDVTVQIYDPAVGLTRPLFAAFVP